jgi:hypothetical protein
VVEASAGGGNVPTATIGVDASLVSVGGVCPNAGSGVGATSCGCSRRPTAPGNFECPAGVGESVSEVVGPSGATLQLAGRMFTTAGVDAQIAIPPTAIATSTTVTLTETSIPPPHDFLDWSPVYRIDPVGFQLAARAPVQFPWSNLSGVVPQRLSIWFSPDGSCFTPLADNYVNAGFNMGSTTQLGYFIVAVERTASTSSCP